MSSSSSDESHSPPILTMSLARSVMRTESCAFQAAMSCVCSQPPSQSFSELAWSLW